MKKNYFLILVCIFLSSSLYAQVWQPVGTPTGVSAGAAGRLSMFTDYQDNLFIAYYDVTVTNASAQKFDGTSWSYLGEGAGFTAGTGLYNTFAVDNVGTAFFTNQKAWPATGMEARKFENGAWSQLPDVTSINVNFQASVISPDNTLFVVSGDNSGTVKKLSATHDYWDQVGDTGFMLGAATFVDMVVGTNDKVYVSFNNSGHVHVYESDIDADADSFWTSVVDDNIAPAATSENYNSSLAIDSENNLYLAYVSNTAGGNKLNVKKYDGTSWIQLGSENFSPGKVQHVSIAVNTDDKVYVAMSNWENDNFLKNYVLTYDETANSWSQAGIGFASEGQATNNSLAIDSFGNLYLAFNDSALGKVSVKKCNMALTPAESIAITTLNSVPAAISIDNGTLQLVSSVTPAAANQNVVWSIVSGETLATIDQTGLVTAIASNGIVTAKATSAENASISNTIEINITNQNSEVQAQEVKITTSGNSDTYIDLLSIGTTLQLSSQVTPIEANQDVIWTIQEGTGVVSINTDGLVTSLTEGTAVVRASHINTNTLYDEITIKVWDDACSQGVELDYESTLEISYNITTTSNKRAAADFTVAENTTLTIHQIKMNVIIQNTTDLINNFNLTFLTQNNAQPQPNQEFLTLENITPTSQTLITDLSVGYLYQVVIELPEPVEFTEGTYWLNPDATVNNGGSVFWQATTTSNVGSDLYTSTGDGGNWYTWDLAGDNLDAVLEITGYCTASLGVDSTNKTSFKYFPNPVTDKLNFTTESSIKNITVYNLLGQTMAAKVSNNTLDTASLPSGTYLVKAELENGQSETFKIIKK